MEVPVRVVARVKPCLPEDTNDRFVQVAPTASQIILGFDNFCDFDAVFGEDVSQKELYNTCLVDMVTNFFQGFNTTVLSYGQQGSGKTYTMTGPDFLWAMNEEEFGLLPQAIRHIFKMMNEVPEREYRVHISYLIIHQEAVYDLLSSRQPLSPLNVLEDSVGNVVIPGLTVVDCGNITEVFNCLEAGLLQQHSASTQGFDVATAHTMFSFTLEHQWADHEGRMNYLYSRINFVDLAGNEDTFGINYNDIGGLPNSIKNNFFINTDLKVLANVVQCLVNKRYRRLIPYRDSRLTHILKDSFGGNSITLMVCCVSPLNKDYDASYNTLKLGSLTRYVTNFPTLNLVLQNSMQSLTSPHIPSNITSVWSSRPSTHTGNLSITPISQSLTLKSINIPPQQGIPHQPNPNYQTPIISGTNPSLGSTEELASHENDEIFKVQFAASQWHILVSSAEDLLAEILQSGNISPADKSRIQSWLCMKAEADECIGSDPPLQNETDGNRPLEVIEELSEPNDVMGGSVDSRKSESEISSSGSSLGEEFYDQLETLREKFFILTSDLVKDTESQYLTRDKFWEDSSPKKSVEGEESQKQSSNETPTEDRADIAQVECMSLSEDSSSFSLSEMRKTTETRGSKSENEENVFGREKGGTSCCNTPVQESFQPPKTVPKREIFPDISAFDFADNENLEGESDKENLASNFGSRLSLISKTSSVSSAETKKVKKKSRGRKRSERMVQKLKRISNLGKTSNQDSRTNNNPVVAMAEDSHSSSAVDINAFSRELEESLEGEEEGLGASSEKELIRRVSSKFVSVSKGSSKCVNSLKSKSFQLKRSIRSHIFKRRNKVNQLPTDDTLETNKSSHLPDVPCSVRRVSDELKVAKERLEELKATIKVKEAFIQELKISGTEAEMTRKKCKLQMERLEEELSDVTKMHHKAQNKMMEALDDDEDEKMHYRNKIYDYSKKMNHLRKKMTSLDKVASISQHNDVKVKELEKSILELREEQEELHTKLREEMQWKKQLEQQILREHRCARNPLCSSSKLMDEDSDREGDVEVVEKPFAMDSLKAFSADKSANDSKKGPSKKRKLANSTGDSQSEKSWRGDSRIGLKDKSKSGLPDSGVQEIDSKCPDFIRKEIDLIRIARDNLITKRQKIDKRIRKGRSKGNQRDEERKLLEYDEAVEGLDSIIERKNEILTGRATQMLPFSPLLAKNDLEERLKNLPVAELHFILVKYFMRVIDLRIEFRRQELAFAELENQYDEQNRYISNLKAAYQQASLEMERRLTSLQREYQYKISYLLRQFNDDSAGHGVQEMKLYEMEQQLYYYKKLSRELKDKLKEYLNQGQSRQIREFESIPGPSGVVKNHRFDRDPMRVFLPHRSDPSPPMTPQVWPRRGRRFAMSTVGASNTTKVTRQKNKLIIQQNGENKSNG